MQGAEELQKDLWPTGPVEALDHSQLEKLADGDRDTDTLVVLYAPWCQYSQVRSCRAYLIALFLLNVLVHTAASCVSVNWQSDISASEP